MRSQTKRTLKIYWQHASRYPWHIVAIIFGVLGHISLQNYAPILYKQLIDILAEGDKSNIAPLVAVIKTIFIVSIIRMIVARLFNYTNNYFQPKVMSDLNTYCFKYLQEHSLSFFSNNFVGSLVTKVKRFEKAFEQISDQLTFELGRLCIETFLIVSILIYYNRIIGIMALVWVILYLIFSYFFTKYKLPVDLKRAQTDSKVTAQLANSISNNFNVKIFSGYEKEGRHFEKISNEQFIIRKKSWDLGTTSDLFQGLSMIILEFFVLYLSIQNWQQGYITIGTIALTQSYFLRLFDKYWSVGKHIRNFYEALADANEMTEILLTPHEVIDAPEAGKIKITKAKIEFKKVNFSYKQDIQVLKNFSLAIHSNEKIALIGPSGGGKSTIAKLLLRFTDIQAGEINIDGQNIANVTQDSLRENIALVPQDPILFHRTLMANIRYGKPSASDEEVMHAAKLAHAHEFISKQPEGYKTFVGERGIKLSGGERQRIAIARAILKNAPILILDEATSSLDSESEHFIQDALKNLMQDKTVIVIAHRLSTIMQMDRIVVLENGRILEEGKHEELIKVKKGTYQKLWHIQAGGFA